MHLNRKNIQANIINRETIRQRAQRDMLDSLSVSHDCEERINWHDFWTRFPMQCNCADCAALRLSQWNEQRDDNRVVLTIIGVAVATAVFFGLRYLTGF